MYKVFCQALCSIKYPIIRRHRAYNILRVIHMDENAFGARLAKLRSKRNVTAREMSLAIGQNPSYINRIENGLNYPSMQGFFFICEYLGIRPAEFFEEPGQGTSKQKLAYQMMCDLTDAQFDAVFSVIKAMKT